MIQRVQTVYLLFVVALTAAMLFLPLAWFAGNGTFELHAFAFQTTEGVAIHSTIYLGILLMLATVLPLVTIFLFHRRMLQIRLCGVEMVLLLGVLIMEGTYYWFGQGVFENELLQTQGFKPAFVLPILGILFAWLAARAILRDEVLVRDADRIR